MKRVRRSMAGNPRNSATLVIGEKIILPSHGPCLIDALVQQLIDGMSISCYRLTRLEDGGGQLFIPVDKIRGLGFRRLLLRSEIPKIFSRLSRNAKPTILPHTARSWMQRAFDCSKLLASGTAIDLVRVVKVLTDLSAARPLGPRDRHALERAKRLLVCEIAEVTGDARSTVAERVDIALNTRRAKTTAAMEPAGQKRNSG